MFFITFLVFRIGLNTYATVVLWIAHLSGVSMAAHMPAWLQWFLLGAVSTGAALQFAWFQHGVRKHRLGDRLVVLVRRGGRPAAGRDGLRAPARTAAAAAAAAT